MKISKRVMELYDLGRKEKMPHKKLLLIVIVIASVLLIAAGVFAAADYQHRVYLPVMFSNSPPPYVTDCCCCYKCTNGTGDCGVVPHTDGASYVLTCYDIAAAACGEGYIRWHNALVGEGVICEDGICVPGD